MLEYSILADRQTDRQTDRQIIYSHTDSTCTCASIFKIQISSLQTTKSLTNGLDFECQNQIIYLNHHDYVTVLKVF